MDVCTPRKDGRDGDNCNESPPHQTSFLATLCLTDRVSPASVKAGAAGGLAPGAVGVTARLVGCIR